MAPRTIAVSGNQSIDGLLAGVGWDVSALTFSFPTHPSLYDDDGDPTNINSYGPENTIAHNFQPADGAGSAQTDQKVAVAYALGLIESYTGLSFQEITETTTSHGNIRFALTDFYATAAGYFPMDTYKSGDIWMNPNGGPTYMDPRVGNWGLATILHEVGHAVGLKHGHESLGAGAFDPGTLPTLEDTWNSSLMTYRSFVGATTNPVSGNVESDNPGTYMPNDIAALQYIYGANFSSRSGDTLYHWEAATGTVFIDGENWGTPINGKTFMTVWDGNGIDTYDLSEYQADLTVDLRPGAYSIFDPAQLADLDGSATHRPAAGNVANARLFQGDGRSLIENAVGGAGNDRLTGNAAANRLSGGAGTDTLEGGSNNDVLDGGASTNTSLFSGARGNYTIVTNVDGAFTVADTRPGGDGSDRLSNIQFARFSDQTITLISPEPPPPPPPPPVEPRPALPITIGGSANAETLVGNAADNKIFGYAGKDQLRGGGGDDLLFGGVGNDTLSGESGRDFFVFDTRPHSRINMDLITDFSRPDTILLDDKFFKVGHGSLMKMGKLAKEKFYIGKAAHDGSDRVILNKTTGVLSYDADGNGPLTAIKFALLKPKVTLSHTDFLVI